MKLDKWVQHTQSVLAISNNNADGEKMDPEFEEKWYMTHTCMMRRRKIGETFRRSDRKLDSDENERLFYLPLTGYDADTISMFSQVQLH